MKVGCPCKYNDSWPSNMSKIESGCVFAPFGHCDNRWDHPLTVPRTASVWKPKCLSAIRHILKIVQIVIVNSIGRLSWNVELCAAGLIGKEVSLLFLGLLFFHCTGDTWARWHLESDLTFNLMILESEAKCLTTQFEIYSSRTIITNQEWPRFHYRIVPLLTRAIVWVDTYPRNASTSGDIRRL